MRKSFIILVLILLVAGFSNRAEIEQKAGEFFRSVSGEFLSRFKQTAEDIIAEEIEKRIITPSPLRVPVEPATPVRAPLSIEGVIEWTNYERQQENLPPLAHNALLDRAAAAKVDDMFRRQYFEHVSPSGEGPGDLADRAGYEYIMAGENLAMGIFSDDKDLVAAWMASQGHKENILHVRYQEIGVSVKRGMFEGRSVWLAVQEFGLPASACPAPDKALAAAIEAGKAELSAFEAELAARRQEIDSTEPKQGKEYNDKVRAYNDRVAEYNALLEGVKRQVSEYNGQVRELNDCVAGA